MQILFLITNPIFLLNSYHSSAPNQDGLEPPLSCTALDYTRPTNQLQFYIIS